MEDGDGRAGRQWEGTVAKLPPATCGGSGLWVAAVWLMMLAEEVAGYPSAAQEHWIWWVESAPDRRWAFKPGWHEYWHRAMNGGGSMNVAGGRRIDALSHEARVAAMAVGDDPWPHWMTDTPLSLIRHTDPRTTYVWERARLAVIATQGNRCGWCRAEMADPVVHHRVPIAEDPGLAFELHNLIALDRDCHDMAHRDPGVLAVLRRPGFPGWRPA